ncbi:MAG: sulfite exporter TauE/SafE family protein [Acidobacteria bacterium]|nr:sulfite exporter TauE/SafE family protein [Acidobacteriota bacterium]MBP8272863.1 sulfite exporter TauE/SafE family protein [Acidobacteriota bacterium]
MIDTLGIALGGLILGAAGSGHCASMCGPLVVLANPRADDDGRRRLARHTLLYHGGRLATYTGLGGIIGLTGGALASAGLGRALAFAAAAAVLFQAVAAWHTFRGGTHSAFGAVVTRAIGRAGGWMRQHRISGPALFGGLTGLLPCGLVYGALTAAAGFGHVGDSALFMLAFGVGTVPMLATIGLSAGRVERWLPVRVKKVAPIALAAVALLLIVRASGGHMDHGATAPSATAQPGTSVTHAGHR